MPLIPLPLAAQSYDLPSKAAHGARLVNLYAERMPEAARSPFILKPTPGLLRVGTVGAGPIWAMAPFPGMLYVVSGERAYRLRSSDLNVQDLGDIGPSGAAHSIAIGPRQAVICNPPRAWVCDHDGVLSEIALPDRGASAVCFIDGFFIFTAYEGTYFFTSKVNTPGEFDPLDFAVSERRPDIVQWATAHNGELWLFGLNHMAVWYNAGLADFAFRERAGTVQARGVASLRTIASLDRSLVFLGNDRVVYRTAGYQLQRISDHALEERLSRYQDLRAITGCAFMWQGHLQYALRLPGEEIQGPTQPGVGQTFVWDAATNVWHERATFRQQVDGPWRVDRSVEFGVLTAMGGWLDGTLYRMDENTATDDGAAINRLAVLPPLEADGARQFMGRLEVEMDTGPGSEAPAAVHLDWSDDGARTWSAGRDIAVSGRRRVAANRLGSFRQRLLRLRCQGRATIYGVDADVQAGAH